MKNDCVKELFVEVLWGYSFDANLDVCLPMLIANTDILLADLPDPAPARLMFLPRRESPTPSRPFH